MNIKQLTANLSVSAQVMPADMAEIAAAGFKSIICNRPDGEAGDQPSFREVEQQAQAAGIVARHLPVIPGQVADAQADEFDRLLEDLPKPVLAYCRSGMRSTTLWGLSRAGRMPTEEILTRAEQAGYDLSALVRRINQSNATPFDVADSTHKVVIVGGGAAGISVASSLLARQPGLDIAIIDPADVHYYQPGWTLVGGGVFKPAQTARVMGSLIPRGVRWIKSAVAGFEPERNAVLLEGCRVVKYEQLVVCPGLKLNWDGIEGLTDTLGRNGVTSNYRYDLAPYTWELVERFKGGDAVFTQPPMPIKCAGAPQKAMYLSCDAWRHAGVLKKSNVQFRSAGAVLFGVAEYVPALMEYVQAYGIDLNFGHTLTAIDGGRKIATFAVNSPDGSAQKVEVPFDMIHVVPPQTAPDFIRSSPLADPAGWIDVDQSTLQHKRFANIFGLGDAANSPNAKTAAAARKQAPVVAHNVLHNLGRQSVQARYNGYGSCPLTVERGKIVLAEFNYGGKLAPSFPEWMLDGTRPSRLAWLLKERILPPLYWEGMLKGHEWLAQPEMVG
ncbi:bifunctional protein tyrosine phosphatase family protein/NAD(P)/FAD-dependent oxidoreductase [Herbaspirillum camelliae]|uniref:bifunctional protein tyrosine phosphatase family protein/NAD(P)/FAD-dependent oxidoreductase n=1 Tax=Herbaspirillum camelliae TaxID=1892903 RepID=UPI000949D1EE|nr:bifunctional protein tyrosine phosphatase family protein/NAD(P)/FAD-dependent oxidoreductase [Herbaspirillum camelliae]